MVSRNVDEGGPTRVLLIDDGTVFLLTVLTFLQQAPEVQVVGMVGSLQEALAKVDLLRVQVVISDLAKAGLPDLTHLAELHAVFPKIGVIILTLLDLEPYREAALAAGATEFVSRVSAGVDLLPAIRRGAAASQDKSGPGPHPCESVMKGTGKKIEIAPRPL